MPNKNDSSILLNNPAIDALIPPKVLAFDLDLTLHNVIDHYHLSLNSTFVSFGFPELSDSELDQFGGSNYPGTRQIFATIMPEELLDQAMKYYIEHFLNSDISPKAVIPGAKEILHLLKKRFKIPVIGVTNSDETIAKKILVDLNLTKLFDFVIGIREDIAYKPNPQMLLMALKHIKMEPGQHVWFVGDMPSDVECAKRANCTAIRFYYKIDPKDPEADLCINNHYHLFNIISSKLKK